jgi:hypothetical protein
MFTSDNRREAKSLTKLAHSMDRSPAKGITRLAGSRRRAALKIDLGAPEQARGHEQALGGVPLVRVGIALRKLFSVSTASSGTVTFYKLWTK